MAIDSCSDSATATTAIAMSNNPPAVDVLEERLIDEEYRIWKKNTPFLYDYVETHSLEWPSLTCQWLPTVKNGNEHTLLLGTHTSGEQNYLMVVHCVLPECEEIIPAEKDESASKDLAMSRANDKALPNKKAKLSNDDDTVHELPKNLRFMEDKQELGGYGLAPSKVGKIEIKMKIPHQGEVNRARYMPQNPFIVASRGPDREVYIFDLSKHSSFPTPIATNKDNSSGTSESYLFTPQGVCVGHEAEGYGMIWNPHKEGQLCTCSDDTTVRLWDVKDALATKETGTQISSTAVLQGHTDVVNDVDWHWRDPDMLCSVGDDRQLIIWDLKTYQAMHKIQNIHDGDAMCVAFNPVQEHILATGGADKKIKLWDMRNLKKCIYTLDGHNDHIYQISWAPFNESILGSCSADRRVAVWDMSRIGMEQTAEDAEDGPPELLFLHAGHTNRVSDFSWNTNDIWSIASVSDENVLQVWRMSENIYADDDEDDDDEDTGDANGKIKATLLNDDDLE